MSELVVDTSNLAGITCRYKFPVASTTGETRLTADERRAWVRFAAVVELLPGVLDTQLTRDENLTHFDYFTAMLSEAPARTLRMTALAAQTNSTLPAIARCMAPGG